MDISRLAAQELIPDGNHPEMQKLIELPLNEDSVVVIVGSYKGITAHIIAEAFRCHIWCFEPQLYMCRKARVRLQDFERVRIREYALGAKTGDFLMMDMGNDSASFFVDPERESLLAQVRMASAFESFRLEGIDRADLLFMNCEGGEYEILTELQPWLAGCEHIMIQFHRRWMPEGWQFPFTDDWRLLWQPITSKGRVIPSWELWSRGEVDDPYAGGSLVDGVRNTLDSTGDGTAR